MSKDLVEAKTVNAKKAPSIPRLNMKKVSPNEWHPVWRPLEIQERLLEPKIIPRNPDTMKKLLIENYEETQKLPHAPGNTEDIAKAMALAVETALLFRSTSRDSSMADAYLYLRNAYYYSLQHAFFYDILQHIHEKLAPAEILSDQYKTSAFVNNLGEEFSRAREGSKVRTSARQEMVRAFRTALTEGRTPDEAFTEVFEHFSVQKKGKQEPEESLRRTKRYFEQRVKAKALSEQEFRESLAYLKTYPDSRNMDSEFLRVFKEKKLERAFNGALEVFRQQISDRHNLSRAFRKEYEDAFKRTYKVTFRTSIFQPHSEESLRDVFKAIMENIFEPAFEAFEEQIYERPETYTIFRDRFLDAFSHVFKDFAAGGLNGMELKGAFTRAFKKELQEKGKLEEAFIGAFLYVRKEIEKTQMPEYASQQALERFKKRIKAPKHKDTAFDEALRNVIMAEGGFTQMAVCYYHQCCREGKTKEEAFAEMLKQFPAYREMEREPGLEKSLDYFIVQLRQRKRDGESFDDAWDRAAIEAWQSFQREKQIEAFEEAVQGLPVQKPAEMQEEDRQKSLEDLRLTQSLPIMSRWYCSHQHKGPNMPEELSAPGMYAGLLKRVREEVVKYKDNRKSHTVQGIHHDFYGFFREFLEISRQHVISKLGNDLPAGTSMNMVHSIWEQRANQSPAVTRPPVPSAASQPPGRFARPAQDTTLRGASGQIDGSSQGSTGALVQRFSSGRTQAVLQQRQEGTFASNLRPRRIPPHLRDPKPKAGDTQKETPSFVQKIEGVPTLLTELSLPPRGQPHSGQGL